MAHYISDMAVFGHVMGTTTDWGEETHHTDYENHVTAITISYSSSYIKPLQFDGALTTLSAGDAAKQLALDTTLDGGGTYTASWMDANYDWSDATFTNRSWESVNLATNKVADVLSTLYDAYTPPKTQTTITCTTSKTNANAGEQITISGTINADVSATVTIYQNVGGSWVQLVSAVSTHGLYSAPITLTSGIHFIRVVWVGNSNYEGATSAQVSLNILPNTPALIQTTISCAASKTNAKDNEIIIISGSINADVSATVTIYHKVGGNWATLAVATSTPGVYSAPISLIEGSYTIKAAWTGDSTYEGATSPEFTITVQLRTGIMKVIVVDEKDSPISGATTKTTTTPTEQASLQGTTSTDGAAIYYNIRVGSYIFNASKTGYNANTGTGQVVEDQTITIKIVLTKKNTSIPGYPPEAVLVGLILVMGYFILSKTNLKILDKSK
jgi:hypothetical protein